MASAMTVVVNIIGSSEGLTKAVASADSSMKGLGESASQMGTKVALAFAAISAAAVAELAAAAATTRSLVADVAALMKVTGLAAAEASGLAFVGQQMGLTAQQMAAAFAIFEKNLVNSTASMEKYGLSLTNADGSQKSFTQVLGEAADVFTTLPKGASQATFAMEVFGRSGRDLIPILNLGSAAISEMSGEAADFNLVIPPETMSSAKSLTAATRDLSAAWDGFQLSIGSTTLGPLTAVTNILTMIVQGATQLPGPLKAAALAFVAVGAGAIAAVPGIVGFIADAAAAGPAMLKIGQMAVAGIKMVQAAVLTGPWGPFIIAIAAVIAIGIVMFKLVQAGLSALSGGWQKMGAIMQAVLIATAPLWLPIVAVIKAVQMIIQGLIGTVQAVAGAIGSMVSSWLAGMGPIGAAIQNVGTILSSLGDIAAANATTAAHEFQTMGLAVVAAAQQGSAGMGTLTQTIAAMRQQLEFADPAKWAAQFQAGLTAVDNALKAGTLNAADAQKAFMAWGLSSSEAAKRTAASLPPVAQSAQQMAAASVKAADVSASGWEKLGAKVQTSMKAIAKAMLSSQKAAMNLAKNTTTVTSKLTSQYGLTADQAAKFLAGATPKSMAAMAKAGGKSFAVVGSAAQKLNGVMPTVATGAGKVAKAVDGAGKSATAAAKGATTLGKGVEGVGKSASTTTGKATGLGKATQSVGSAFTSAAKTAQSAASGTEKLGSSMSGSTGKVNSMTSSVAKLAAELNGLPTKITIEVEVHVTKTGAETGGVTGLARGGVTTKTSGLPLTMVGERGPELAALPPGTRVFSHNDTMGMLRSAADSMPSTDGGGGGEQTIRGKLTLVNGEAFIEGVIVDTLEDGRLVNQVLSRSMRRPG